MSLTPKQDAFVREYLIDLNATQAAIRAGYSAKTAEQQGSRLLRNVQVAAALSEAQTKRAERVEIEPIGGTFSRVRLRYGFMETPNVPKGLAIARRHGWQFDIMLTSFFLSRRALKPAAHSGMPRWQDRLFIALARSANDATDYFQIPTGRVVEVGTQVTI